MPRRRPRRVVRLAGTGRGRQPESGIPVGHGLRPQYSRKLQRLISRVLR